MERDDPQRERKRNKERTKELSVILIKHPKKGPFYWGKLKSVFLSVIPKLSMFFLK